RFFIKVGDAVSYVYSENATTKDFRTNIVDGLSRKADKDPKFKTDLETKPDTTNATSEKESRERFGRVAEELDRREADVTDPKAREQVRNLRDRFNQFADPAGTVPLPTESPKELIDKALADMKAAQRGRISRDSSADTGREGELKAPEARADMQKFWK